MDLKQFVLEGGYLSFSYKTKPEDWIGEATLSPFAYGLGSTPKIVVTIPDANFIAGGRKEYSWDEIDIALEDFKKFVFNPSNLCYKMKPAMRELYNEGFTELDLENSEDYKLFRNKQKLLQ